MRKKHIFHRIAAVVLTASLLVGGSTAAFLSASASTPDAQTENAAQGDTAALYDEYIKSCADEKYVSEGADNAKLIDVLQLGITFAGRDRIAGAAGVYCLDENDSYYAAYVDSMHNDADISAVTLSLKDSAGNEVEGYLFDEDTGILYIPAKDYQSGICAELAYEVPQEKFSKSVALAVVKDGQISSSEFRQMDMGMTSVIALSEPGLDTEQIAVTMNGIPLSADAYVYDPETGGMAVFASPAAVSMISIIEEPDTEKLTGLKELAEAYANKLPGGEGAAAEMGQETEQETEQETSHYVMLGESVQAALAFADSDELEMEFRNGDRVDLIVSVEEPYVVRSITLMDAGSGKTLSRVESEDNLFSFEMPETALYVVPNVTCFEGNVDITYIGMPGTVTTDAEGKTAGETVAVSVQPDDGCKMNWIAVYDGETGVELCVEETEEGYTFVMPDSGKASIEVEFAYDVEMYGVMTEFKYLANSTACTYNGGYGYIGGRFGVTEKNVMNWLNSHRNDNYYLNTAYSVSSRNGGSDNRQPNGDTPTNMTYGYDDYAGVSSLNCTGFVWHALWRACTQTWGCDYNTAYNGIPAWGGIGAGNWSTFLRNNNYEYRTYFTKYGNTDFWSVVGMLTDITNDGYLQPGDIIWCWDANSGSPAVGYYDGNGYAINVGDGLSTASSDHHHTGIYIGDGKWWHSIRSSVYNSGIGATNQISDITAKTYCKAITVIKMSQTPGYLTLKKTSSNTSVTSGNSNYSLEGAAYGVYKDAACTQAAVEGFLANVFFTDAGGNCGKMELPPGTYYVKEATASPGYQLDSTVYTVNVTVNHTSAAPYVLNVKEVPQLAKVKVQKRSANAAITDGNANYSLQGAVYSIYSDAACTKLVTTMTTDASGNATSAGAAAGTYYVKETTVSKGYKLCDGTDGSNKGVHTVTVSPGQTATFTCKEPPASGKLTLSKTSANPSLTDGNSCYSLQGAGYTVYSDLACTKAVTTLTTDENGNTPTVDIAAGTYYVKETTASKGYLLCDGSLDRAGNGIHTVTVTAGTTAKVSCKEMPTDDPFSLTLQKMDYDTKQPKAKGITSLEGAVFELTYYTNIDGKTDGTPFRKWYFRTNDKGILNCANESYFVSNTTLHNGTVLKSDALYRASGDTKIIYPLGTYCLKEVSAPKYYRLEGTMNFIENPGGRTDVNLGLKAIIMQPSNGSATQIYDGDHVMRGTISVENLAVNVYDRTENGSIKIIKLAADTNRPLAGVTFRLVGVEDGTEQTATTDSNGEIIWSDLIPQHYVVTEVSTVDGNTLLKDNIEITLPTELTAEEIETTGADINKAVYDKVSGKYCFYDMTCTIGNSVTFSMPMTGDSQTGLYFMLTAAFALIGFGIVLFRWRKKKAPMLS